MYRLRPRKPRLWYTRLGSYYAVYVVRGSRLGPLVRVATVNGYRLDFSQYPRLESFTKRATKPHTTGRYTTYPTG